MALRMLRKVVSPPAVSSYDSEWEEVKAINGYAVVTAYVSFAIRGLGYLVVTWTTVVLLGGFVDKIDSDDFRSLALITLVQILWINASFLQRLGSTRDLPSSLKALNNLFTRSWVQADNPRVGHQIVKKVVAAIGCVEALVHTVLLRLCLGTLLSVMLTGMLVSIWISVRGLIHIHRGEGEDDDAGRNMDAAHDVLYVMCVFQGTLLLYKNILMICKKRVVKQVSRAYGFQECGAVQGYMDEMVRGCFQKPFSARGRNLITYAIELMESKSPRLCLSGTLILDRLLTRKHSDNNRASNLIEQDEKKQQQRQHQQQKKDTTRAPLTGKTSKEKQQQLEEEIIGVQRRVIKGLIGSASYTHILQKLLRTLDPRSPHDRKMRDAAARIVEHVADGIRLEQFPQGIQCISSLINTFGEYHRLQPYQSSSSSKSEPSKSESDNGMDKPSSTNKSNVNSFHGYKELVLIGLRILRSLAASCDNCIIISSTKHLISKIMAPVSFDLVHRTHHSDWSTRTVKESLTVMFLLVVAHGEVGAVLRRRVSSDDKAVATLERIVRCEECKSHGLQITAMQILTLLVCADDEMEIRGNLTKMLVSICVGGDSSDVYVRTAAGEALLLLFFGKRSIATILPGENNDVADFVGGLLKIVSQVGRNDACRISAAEILERVCGFYIENDEYLGTFRNDMTNVMPMVLREVLLGCGSTGEEGNPVYTVSGVDVESQVLAANGGSAASQATTTSSSSPVKHQDNGLHVALLSLCVTACEELRLEFSAMNPAGEGVAFGFVREMVELNKDITVDCLGRMKLATRMVIAMVKHRGATNPADLDLDSLMDLLSSVSENMLDLESSMVFDTGVATTARTLDSLVEEARELHSQNMEQDLLDNNVREQTS